VPAMKQGPLTADELREIWASASDPGYREPMLAAGDGKGMEAWNQLFEQYARVSTAIDRTTQSMFISPWSGQTNPPAGGAAKSTVTLSLKRSAKIERALRIAPGTFVVAEETTDWGENGPEVVLTGRRYFLAEEVVFFPGEAGPYDVLFEAEYEGAGYDDVQPGTITAIVQPGELFQNDLATVTAFSAAVGTAPSSSSTIIADDEADMFVPEQIGQQVEVVSGLSAGLIARISRFISPQPSSGIGSGVEVELFWTAEATSFSGTFRPGEAITIKNGVTLVATGRVVLERVAGGKKRLGFVLLTGGSIVAGRTIAGTTSLATMTISSVLSSTQPVADAPAGGVGGAGWRIVSWADDWGLTTTNALAPSGGRAAMLDELGQERNIYRGANEGDEEYRPRVREIADVVAPNAIKRTVERSYPFTWAFYEAGTSWPGFYYDGTLEPPSAIPGRARNDAYDTDVILYQGVRTGTFMHGERVVTEDQFFREMARGFEGANTGTTFTLLRTSGGLTRPPGTFRVRGLTSGATFAIVSEMIPASATDLEKHTYLDYEQMRAFFWIEVGNLNAGEFGFAYDSGAANAWDVGFFDGYPVGAADYYRRLYQAVDRARAGGVGFELIRKSF
jgi:hypothetical protein